MKKTISKLKKELDKWFSLYIRLREATSEGMVQCFTCGKVAHYKKGVCKMDIFKVEIIYQLDSAKLIAKHNV